VSGTLAEAVWYYKSVRAWYFRSGSGSGCRSVRDTLPEVMW
jgi:hypothetical protein